MFIYLFMYLFNIYCSIFLSLTVTRNIIINFFGGTATCIAVGHIINRTFPYYVDKTAFFFCQMSVEISKSGHSGNACQ